MTQRSIIAGLAGLAAVMVLLTVAPPTQAAVSNAVREDCARKANKVTPPLRAGEREAYITNCIADAAVTPGKAKKKRY